MADYYKWWLEQKKIGKHYCAMVTDPSSCCPKAHNPKDTVCTCWMENDTFIDAERVKQEENLRFEMIQTYRKFGILPKHTIKNNSWAMCHLGNGGGPFKEDGKCSFCNWEVWY